MRKRYHRLIAVLVLIVGIGGCSLFQQATDTPTKRYALAADLYGVTMRSLADLRRRDKLDAEAEQIVDDAYPVATEALQAWKEALKAGDSPEQAIQRFQPAVDQLIMVLEKYGNGNSSDNNRD